MQSWPRRVCSLAFLVVVGLTSSNAAAQTISPAFVYQGELRDAGGPVTGPVDIRFTLCQDAGGTAVPGTSAVCVAAVTPVAGRFTTELNFGQNFPGAERFLQIEVRSALPGGCANAAEYTLLLPRQALRATPYALTANLANSANNAANLNGQPASFFTNSANLTGMVSDARLSSNIARLDANQTFEGRVKFTNPENTFSGIFGGVFQGSGAGLTNLNGAAIAPGTLARSSLSTDVQGGVGVIAPDWRNTPYAVAGSAATGASPNSVAVAGGYAYVANRLANTLQVFNISNPAAPTLAASIGTGDSPNFVTVSGSFAYVVNVGSSTLQVFNVSNPLAPALAGSVGTESAPYAVAVAGSHAYVVNYNSNSLQVFDISNAATPSLVGSINTGFNPISVGVSGAFVYVANFNSSTLRIYSVSNPSAPSLVASIPTGAGRPASLAISGTHAYVVNISPNALVVFDISNPSIPAQVGSVATGLNPISVAVSGPYAMVANYLSDTLQVFDVSNAAAPAQLGSIGTGLSPIAVAVSGPYAYVVNTTSSTLQVIAGGTGVGFGAPLSAAVLSGVNGAGLTNLNGASITGNIADARLSSNVARLDASQNFTGQMTFSNAGNAFIGLFGGNGAGLTNLTSTSLVGLIPDANLPTNLPRNNTANVFSASNTFSQPLGIGGSPTNGLLHIQANQATSTLTSNQAANGSVITLENRSPGLTTGNFVGAINFGTSAGTPGQLGYARGDTLSQDTLRFRAGSLTAVAIDGQARLGLGTLEPASRLHIASGTSGVAASSSTVLLVDTLGTHYISSLIANTEESGLLFGRPSGGNAEAGIVYNNAGTRGGLQLRTGGNQTRMFIDSAGAVTVPGAVNAGNVNYTAPRLTYRMYSVGAFVPGTVFAPDGPVRIGFYRNLIYGAEGSSITLHIPLDLPHNARIRQIEVYCNDLDSTRRMRFSVLGTDLPAQTSSVLTETTTEGLSGSQLTVSLPIPTPILVNNTNRSLEFFVYAERPNGPGYTLEWSSNLQLAGMRIGYETDGPSQ